MKKNIYLSSGEFAELCGTTKETLRHYHNKGLLIPSKQESNGYFYYTINQTLVFELIQLLAHTGNSLQQIKDYLDSYSVENFSKLIKTAYKNLEIKKKEIEHMMRVIDNSVNFIQESKNSKIGEVFIENSPTEYFWTFDIEPVLFEELDILYRPIYNFRKYNKEKNFITEYFYSYFISDKDFLKNNYLIRTIAVKTDFPENSTHTKPEGYYAVIYHKGEPCFIKNSLNKLNKFLSDNNLKICSLIYKNEIINNQITKDEDDYVTKISVQLKEDKNFKQIFENK